jgi:hypothetical protein
LLKKILLAYGETELASDDELIGKMIANAVGESTSEEKDDENQNASVALFDASTFAKALTSDVKLYNVANEVSLSSNHQDVFLAKDKTPASSDDKEQEHISDNKEQEQSLFVQSIPLTLIYTAPAIDTTAGTYRSKGWYPLHFPISSCMQLDGSYAAFFGTLFFRSFDHAALGRNIILLL